MMVNKSCPYNKDPEVTSWHEGYKIGATETIGDYTINHQRWLLAEIDELIFMLDVVVAILLWEKIILLSFLFIIKAALDFVTVFWKARKIKRDGF